jgi:hypothetical protein
MMKVPRNGTIRGLAPRGACFSPYLQLWIGYFAEQERTSQVIEHRR